MSLRDFLSKQFIDVIDWVEPEDGILAYRYPMQDREIQNGGKLTVRDSQYAVFVNEGKLADAFGPGLYTLNTQTLPILTYLKNWDKAFKSPFKSDVYFFSARTQTDQHWGTPNPITIRDKEFGAIRLRGFGIYSYHLTDAKTFYSKISGTRDLYRVADLEGQLRNTIVAKMTDAFATSQIPFLDMAANQGMLAQKISDQLKPAFAEYGTSLDTFVVENLSLPDELQKVLDQRISMNVIGDMGKFTQYECFEEPRSVRQMPLHGTRIAERLHHLIFSRHTRGQSTCRRPHGLVFGTDGDIPHVASNSAAISLYRFYLAWRCGNTDLSHSVLLRTFHSASTGSDSSVLNA